MSSAEQAEQPQQQAGQQLTKKQIKNRKKRERAKAKKREAKLQQQQQQQQQQAGGDGEVDAGSMLNRDAVAAGSKAQWTAMRDSFETLAVRELFADPWELKLSRARGRHPVASRAIGKGERIVSTPAYAAVISDQHVNSVCSVCFGTAATMMSCGGCGFASFCSTACVNRASSVHKLECHAINKIKSMGLQDSATLRLVVRILYTKRKEENDAQRIARARRKKTNSVVKKKKTTLKYEDFHDLVANEFMFTVKQRIGSMKVLTSLKELVHKDDMVDDDELLGILFRIQSNAHHVRSGVVPVGIGVFPVMAYVNHSCEPNAVYSFHDGQVHVHALRPIKKGEEVVSSYIAQYQATSQRIQALRQSYQFDTCRCDRCARPVHECADRYLAGFKCPEHAAANSEAKADDGDNDALVVPDIDACYTADAEDDVGLLEYWNASSSSDEKKDNAANDPNALVFCNMSACKNHCGAKPRAGFTMQALSKAESEGTRTLEKISTLYAHAGGNATVSRMALDMLQSELFESEDCALLHPRHTILFNGLRLGMELARMSENHNLVVKYALEALKCLARCIPNEQPEVGHVFESLAQGLMGQTKTATNLGDEKREQLLSAAAKAQQRAHKVFVNTYGEDNTITQSALTTLRQLKPANNSSSSGSSNSGGSKANSSGNNSSNNSSASRSKSKRNRRRGKKK